MLTQTQRKNIIYISKRVDSMKSECIKSTNSHWQFEMDSARVLTSIYFFHISLSHTYIASLLCFLLKTNWCKNAYFADLIHTVMNRTHMKYMLFSKAKLIFIFIHFHRTVVFCTNSLYFNVQCNTFRFRSDLFMTSLSWCLPLSNWYTLRNSLHNTHFPPP